RLTDNEHYAHASEIAARLMEDKYDLTCDRIFCDPERRTEFDRIALSIVPGYPTYKYRKAALNLRKARRLAPEPVKRIDAFQKDVLIEEARVYEKAPERVPREPGIYAFLDDTGFLYIGESRNLQGRLKKHLDHSDNRSLARYLWQHGTGQIKVQLFVFLPGSEGQKTRSRKAYEAALIASRSPRFNIQCLPAAPDTDAPLFDGAPIAPTQQGR
ncbi:GIY-YIG nuclease family protein, partial [bacterium]|nr:GIY-YIG nuclease family protein [bacterium]